MLGSPAGGPGAGGQRTESSTSLWPPPPAHQHHSIGGNIQTGLTAEAAFGRYGLYSLFPGGSGLRSPLSAGAYYPFLDNNLGRFSATATTFHTQSDLPNCYATKTAATPCATQLPAVAHLELLAKSFSNKNVFNKSANHDKHARNDAVKSVVATKRTATNNPTNSVKRERTVDEYKHEKLDGCCRTKPWTNICSQSHTAKIHSPSITSSTYKSFIVGDHLKSQSKSEITNRKNYSQLCEKDTKPSITSATDLTYKPYDPISPVSTKLTEKSHESPERSRKRLPSSDREITSTGQSEPIDYTLHSLEHNDRLISSSARIIDDCKSPSSTKQSKVPEHFYSTYLPLSIDKYCTNTIAHIKQSPKSPASCLQSPCSTYPYSTNLRSPGFQSPTSTFQSPRKSLSPVRLELSIPHKNDPYYLNHSNDLLKFASKPEAKDVKREVTERLSACQVPEISTSNHILSPVTSSVASVVVKTEPRSDASMIQTSTNMSTLSALSSCSTATGTIPVGIAVARQRLSNDITTTHLHHNASPVGGGLLTTTIGPPHHLKELDATSVCATAMTVGIQNGGGSIIHCNDERANNSIAWPMPPTHSAALAATPTLWQYPVSAPLPIEAMQLPLSMPAVPVGYQLVRDPASGHLLLIPAATTANFVPDQFSQTVVWPSYAQPTSQHLILPPMAPPSLPPLQLLGSGDYLTTASTTLQQHTQTHSTRLVALTTDSNKRKIAIPQMPPTLIKIEPPDLHVDQKPFTSLASTPVLNEHLLFYQHPTNIILSSAQNQSDAIAGLQCKQQPLSPPIITPATIDTHVDDDMHVGRESVLTTSVSTCVQDASNQTDTPVGSEDDSANHESDDHDSESHTESDMHSDDDDQLTLESKVATTKISIVQSSTIDPSLDTITTYETKVEQTITTTEIDELPSSSNSSTSENINTSYTNSFSESLSTSGNSLPVDAPVEISKPAKIVEIVEPESTTREDDHAMVTSNMDVSGLELLSNSIIQYENSNFNVKQIKQERCDESSEPIGDELRDELIDERVIDSKKDLKANVDTNLGGLGLLCALAEQRIMEEVTETNDVDENVEGLTDVESLENDARRLKQAKRDEERKACCTIWSEMHEMQQDMRNKIADLERQFKEKQIKLTKLSKTDCDKHCLKKLKKSRKKDRDESEQLSSNKRKCDALDESDTLEKSSSKKRKVGRPKKYSTHTETIVAKKPKSYVGYLLAAKNRLQSEDKPDDVPLKYTDDELRVKRKKKSVKVNKIRPKLKAEVKLKRYVEDDDATVHDWTGMHEAKKHKKSRKYCEAMDDLPNDEPANVDRCTLTPEHLLTDRLRVLTSMGGLFYAGVLSAIQAPDVYAITLDGERGNRPHIMSREEILRDAIIEIAPESTTELAAGTRLCAYWSQQYRCLYPGTIADDADDSRAVERDERFVNVEFDDGDSGRIRFDDIRFLPVNYPIVEYDPNPLLSLSKRKRRASSQNSQTSDDAKLTSPTRAPLDVVAEEPVETVECVVRKHKKKKHRKRHTDEERKAKKHKHHKTCDEHCTKHKKHHKKHRKHKKRHRKDEVAIKLETFDDVDDSGPTIDDATAQTSNSSNSTNVDGAPGSNDAPLTMNQDLNVNFTVETIHADDDKLDGSIDDRSQDATEDGSQVETEDDNASDSTFEPSKHKSPKQRKERSNSTASTESCSKMASFLPQKKLWKWAGEGYKRRGARGRARKQFFKAIQRGKEIISVGDAAVFLSTGSPDRPFIGLISSMWEKWNGQKEVTVKWFYHPQEVPVEIGDYSSLKYSGGLFESEHMDSNDVQTISHKCEVLPFEQYRERFETAANDTNDTYYRAGYYDLRNQTVQIETNVPFVTD